MNILSSLLFILIASFFFAKVEITIEGSAGWAENLPTWKVSKEHWISRLFFGRRPATGYHVWINAFILFILHVVYLFQSLSLAIELQLLALFILFWVFEDFLWFLLNPAYGLKNFRKEKIWWHRDNWWLIAPKEYFIWIPIGIMLACISHLVI